jgi:hypothetical protein
MYILNNLKEKLDMTGGLLPLKILDSFVKIIPLL